MSASLVGSEMCIRDSPCPCPRARAREHTRARASRVRARAPLAQGWRTAVRSGLALVAAGATFSRGALSLIHISEPTRLALI
eukprot:11520182-Alexandrium_andersonii.AAC.1